MLLGEIRAALQYTVPDSSGAAPTPVPARPPRVQAAHFTVEWIHVPEGHYKAGSDPSCMRALLKRFGLPEDNLRVLCHEIREVWVPEFWITRFPVTNELYEAFVRDTGRALPRNWGAPGQVPSHPVVWIGWTEAREFAEWLGCELTTIYEWEKAARGCDDLRCYPWGDQFDKARCRCAEDKIGCIAPVGTYPAGDSPYGVSDMVGNVLEWTKDHRSDGYVAAKGGAFDMTCEVYGLIHFTAWVQDGFPDEDRGFRLVSHVDPGHLRVGTHVIRERF